MAEPGPGAAARLEGRIAGSLRTRAGIAAVFGIVVVISFLLYLPTVRYDFVWDDTSLITRNELLADASPGQLFTQAFWAGAPESPGGPAVTYYRPLTTLSFWADLKLAGPNPWYFHLVNAVLNALAAGLLALVVWELLHSGVWAGLAGLLFAVHSSHVESTAFISGRTDLLLALFILLASFALVRSLRKRDIRWWALVPAGFFLALLAKETAILFPVLVGLAPLLTQTRYDRRYWALLVSCVLVGAGYLLLRHIVIGPSAGLPFVGFVELANTFGLYVKMLAWPFAHRAKFPLNPDFVNLTSNAIAALLFVATVPLLAIRRRFRVSLFGYVWVILFMLPVAMLSIGPQAAERLVYLPSAGFAMILVCVVSRLLHASAALRRYAGIAIGLLILVMGWETVGRSRVWRNEATLFSAMTREAPSAPSAYANLADAIGATLPDSAIRLYNKAISLDQGFVHAHINISTLLSRQSEFREALHHLRLANQLQPGSAEILNNLGLVFLAAGRPDSAVAYLRQAVEVEPSSAPAHLNLSSALAAAGFDARSDSEIRRSLELDPGMVSARLALADRFERENRLDSAAHQLEQAALVDPPAAEILNRLGTVLIRKGDSTAAQQSYLKALALDSTFVPALYNQAVLYVARGDTTGALALAGRAYRLRPDLAPVRDIYVALSGSQ